MLGMGAVGLAKELMKPLACFACARLEISMRVRTAIARLHTYTGTCVEIWSGVIHLDACQMCVGYLRRNRITCYTITSVTCTVVKHERRNR